MKANSSRHSFHIKKPENMNMKYFVYDGKEYPVNFDLLKINSNYFNKNQKQYIDERCIELIDENDKYVKLDDESIQAFISSCQNEPCSIEKSSIIQLQYLAHKYEFTKLIQFTDTCIKDHSEDLFFPILFFKINEMKGKNNNNSFFDTSKEEQIISDNLSEFIQKDEMLNLPIEFLYRVFTHFFEHQKNYDEIKNDVTTFLFKCLDKYGKPASVLFNIIDFGEQKTEVVYRLLENYSNKFDFNLINKTLAETVKDLTSEVSKQKEEYSKLFMQMQETFNEQLTELKKMKEQEEEKQKLNEIENQKRIENFTTDINVIKKDVDDKIRSIQDQFQQICRKQEDYIDNATVNKFHQMILETITYGQFLKFDDKLRDHFITEFDKIEQKNKEESFYANAILNCISIPESYENIQIIQIFKGDLKDYAKIKITNDIIECLNQKEQLDSCLTKCINISNNLLVEIEYPCNKFEQKMKIISDIKTQKCPNLKVSVTVNDKSYFEQNEFIDNVDVIKYHEMFLETITFSQFRRFDGESKDNFIEELYRNEKEQNNKNEILRAQLFLNLSSLPESYDHIQVVDFLRKNDQIKFKLTKDKVEDLYQMNQLDSCLTNCAMTFNDFLVEIEYPCKNFEQIMKIISDNKTQNGENMKVSVTINDKSYFEQENKWNKIINTCKVGQSIDVIPEKSFCEFSKLTNIEMSPNTVRIESSSFQNCSSLTEVAIPTSVKSIGEHCFEDCSKLDRLTINPFYTQIQFNTFNKCHSLKHFTILTARDNKSKTNEHILISYNMTDVLYQTDFLNSSELTSYINECSEIIFEVQYPSSNFSNIYKKLISVRQNHSSKMKLGVFYTQKETTDKYFYNNNEINYVRFDSNIKRTPNDGNSGSDGSFKNCRSLIEVFVPSSLNKIGSSTFKECSSLKKINFELPSSITSIGDYAFRKCSSLTQITIPSSVTSIGSNAFFECSSLTQVTIPSSVTSIGSSAFSSCFSLTQITIPSSVTSIGSSAFSSCFSLTQITIPSSVISIGECAFVCCRKLTQITIPSSVTSIRNSVFSGCSSLTQITIPSHVTSIGGGVFSGCSSLAQITIPSSVNSIGRFAFIRCSSLTQISIPSKIDTSNLRINSNTKINRT